MYMCVMVCVCVCVCVSGALQEEPEHLSRRSLSP